MKTYAYTLTSFAPRYVLTLQTLPAAPATTSAVAMPNALSEYRAPLKLPSFSAFANGVVCAGAPSVPREDRGIAEGTVIPPRCGSRDRARLLTGGEVGTSREDVRPSRPMTEVAVRCCLRRKARGRARAAVVTASWREGKSEQEK